MRSPILTLSLLASLALGLGCNNEPDEPENTTQTPEETPTPRRRVVVESQPETTPEAPSSPTSPTPPGGSDASSSKAASVTRAIFGALLDPGEDDEEDILGDE